MVSLRSKFQNNSARYNDYLVSLIKREDLEEIVKWPIFEDPNFAWANFPAKTKELSDRWYKTQVSDRVVWLIVRNTSYFKDQIILRCSITQPMEGEDYLFGIVLRPDLVNRGIGTECSKILLSYVFQMTEIPSIWLETKHDNARARKVWEKIGFSFLGCHYRREIFGSYDKYAGYRILRNEINGNLKITIHKND